MLSMVPSPSRVASPVTRTQSGSEVFASIRTSTSKGEPSRAHSLMALFTVSAPSGRTSSTRRSTVRGAASLAPRIAAASLEHLTVNSGTSTTHEPSRSPHRDFAKIAFFMDLPQQLWLATGTAKRAQMLERHSSYHTFLQPPALCGDALRLQVGRTT